jgi:hypothetical protein
MSEPIDYDTGDQRLDEIFTRLDTLETRVDLIAAGCQGLTDIAQSLIEMQASVTALASMAALPPARLPEDVPQSVRLGKDRPGPS